MTLAQESVHQRTEDGVSRAYHRGRSICRPAPMFCRLTRWLFLPFACLLATHAFAAENPYDRAAAAARTQYKVNAAKCRDPDPEARAACLKLAKAGAHAALSRTYGDAVASAKAVYARSSARCKPMSVAERRRCLHIARAERNIALGKAEEIRSAPLAMGPSNN